MRLKFGFWAAGSLLLLCIALPIMVLLLGTTPADLAATVVDPQVQRALQTTMTAAVLATLFGLTLGIPLAYLLARQRFPASAWSWGC